MTDRTISNPIPPSLAAKLTLPGVCKALAELRPAISISKDEDSGEYRVAFSDLPRAKAEPSAYYTRDLADALETGVCMSREGVPHAPHWAGGAESASYVFSAEHTENTPADMVQDHCNGDDEMLLGVALDGSMTAAEVREALLQEFHALADNSDWQEEDYEAAEAALASCFEGVNDDAPFCPFLPSNADCGSDVDYNAIQAWFRLTWAEA